VATGPKITKLSTHNTFLTAAFMIKMAMSFFRIKSIKPLPWAVNNWLRFWPTLVNAAVLGNFQRQENGAL
jgi:hypothetical protein